jgi:uncharacterized membrane protein YqjE
MENTIDNRFKELSTSLQELIESKVRLFKILLVEKIAKSLYMLAFLVILLFILSLMLVFASVSLAHWISALWHNLYAGYLVVTGLYLLLSLLFIGFRKNLLLNPITRAFYNIIVADENNNNEYKPAA